VESVVSVVTVVAVQLAVVVVAAAVVVVDIVRVVHIDTPVVVGPMVAFEFEVPEPFLDSAEVASLVVAVPIA
jgi:hypothetical protein